MLPPAQTAPPKTTMRFTPAMVSLTILGILAIAVILAVRLRPRPPQPITLVGSVIRQATDPAKQTPIKDVQISAANGIASNGAKSDSNGLFRLQLEPAVKAGQAVTLTFTHPDYRPLTLSEPAGQALYVVAMTPLTNPLPTAATKPPATLSNVTIRYTVHALNAMSIGSAVKTLQVANIGNVACASGPSCSPDGKWKAAVASVALDAGAGNEFRNPKVSCVAGPCPFTKIDSRQLSPDGRWLNVTVRNWSDTATFLIQAEVFRKMSEDVVRNLYPVIFENEMDFTLPGEAEGPSIEAELNGASILFPLSPDLCLTWANCQVRIGQDQEHVYQCTLKPGYYFH
jgi:hypothetical protein